MQRHTLTFRSKKRTKKVVFVNFDIFVYFRIKNKEDFRNLREQCHFSIGKVPLLQGKTDYIDVQNRHNSSAKVAPFQCYECSILFLSTLGILVSRKGKILFTPNILGHIELCVKVKAFFKQKFCKAILYMLYPLP